MMLAIIARSPRVTRSQDAPSLGAAAETSEGPLTPEEYGPDEWWPYQILRGLEEQPHPVESPWCPFGGLIG